MRQRDFAAVRPQVGDFPACGCYYRHTYFLGVIADQKCRKIANITGEIWRRTMLRSKIPLLLIVNFLIYIAFFCFVCYTVIHKSITVETGGVRMD